MRATRPMHDADLDMVCALDREWSGADRGFFIRRRRQLHPDVCHVFERAGAIAGDVLATLRRGAWCAVRTRSWRAARKPWPTGRRPRG
jgi:hypothetical protein